MKLFRARNLKKYYKTEDIEIKAVDEINLEIEESEFIAIVGKSGSGKTTLLNILAVLEKPDSGTVEINGKDISKMDRDEMAIFRRREIGIVFQSYNLVSTLSVLDNILLPFVLDSQNPDMKFVDDIMKSLGIYEKKNMMPHQLSGGEKQRVFQSYNLVSTLSVLDNILLPFVLDSQNPDVKFVDEIMKSLGIYEKKNMMPHQLSGGEKQRTAIARAIAIKPTIILADEPTGNLDSRMSMDVMNMLKVISEKYSQTLIVVTHDESIAQLADRVIHIRDGKIMNGVI